LICLCNSFPEICTIELSNVDGTFFCKVKCSHNIFRDSSVKLLIVNKVRPTVLFSAWPGK
jgi:hypothetical protein